MEKSEETAIVVAEVSEIPAGEIQDDTEEIVVGQWYWIQDKDDKKPWFGCVTAVGTNYAELTSTGQGSCRIHFSDFDNWCKREPNPDRIIKGKIEQHQTKTFALLAEVKEVTARLAIAPSPMLGTNETQALALRSAEQPDMGAYSTALEVAKTETLPELFKKIEDSNRKLAKWMTAQTIPLKAQARGLAAHIEAIDDRIFSVELYAGLVEKVQRIQDGVPAMLTEKVRLIQRRCYMDEECLAQYKTGGMDIQDLEGFDRWLLKPENLERLLPFQRCVVAFRIRRNTKKREISSLIDIFRVMEEDKMDKYTYLYIRNGEQVFRMRTGIEFDEKLFPDMERGKLDGKLWAEMYGTGVKGLITDHDYQERQKNHRRAVAEHKAQEKAYREALKSPEAMAKAKAKGLKKPDASCVNVPWPGMVPWDSDRFEAYDKSNVHYDDVTAFIQAEIKSHNRIALILQGLLDRSLVLHPHPPWQIWTQAGFESAFDLIYDSSRALVAGAAPDWDAYRKHLNSSIKEGSVTLGQETAWLLAEAEKENDRREARGSSRRSYNSELTFFRPHGDPGPGIFARVQKKRGGKCVFEWVRQRRNTYSNDHMINSSISVSIEELFHVDAYKPGDFKQFFNDPRTRADYLQWAPLLIEAEEYHAGNRKAQEPKKIKPVKPPSSEEGQYRYQQQKRIKRNAALYDKKIVTLRYALTTKGGTRYEKGTLWQARHYSGSKFTISQITPEGRFIQGHFMTGVETHNFELAEQIPIIEDEKDQESDDEEENDEE